MKGLLETFKLELGEIKKRTDALGSKFNQLSEVLKDMTDNYNQITECVREWEKRHQVLDHKVRYVDEEHGKNILTSGLEKKRDRSYFELWISSCGIQLKRRSMGLWDYGNM